MVFQPWYGTLGLVNTCACIFSFGRITNWTPVSVCHGQLGDDGPLSSDSCLPRREKSHPRSRFEPATVSVRTDAGVSSAKPSPNVLWFIFTVNTYRHDAIAGGLAENVLLTVYTERQPTCAIHLVQIIIYYNRSYLLGLKYVIKMLIMVFLFFQPGRLACDTCNIEHKCSDVATIFGWLVGGFFTWVILMSSLNCNLLCYP